MHDELGPFWHWTVQSASVNLLEVVTFVTVALFLLIGVVIAALRLAALFAFLFGRLGTPTLSLASADAVRAQVRAARGQVLTTATPTLSLVEHWRWTWFRGPLDRNNRACCLIGSSTLKQSQTSPTTANKDTYRDKRWGVRAPASSLVESCALLLHEALVAVTLQHGLSLGTASLTSAPRTVLETRLGRVPGLDNSRGGLCADKNHTFDPVVDVTMCNQGLK